MALSDTEVADFVKAVGTSRIEGVTWDLLTSILACARHFITSATKAADLQLRTKAFKTWKKVGPSEVSTKWYAYDVGGSTIYAVSLLSLACKEKGVSKEQRALTFIALHSVSDFWRFVIQIHRMCNPDMRAPRPEDYIGAGSSSSGSSLDETLTEGGKSPAALAEVNGSKGAARGESKRKRARGANGAKDPSRPRGKTRRKAASGRGKGIGGKEDKGTAAGARGSLSNMDESAWKICPAADVLHRLKARTGPEEPWYWYYLSRRGPQCPPLSSFATLADLLAFRHSNQDFVVVAGTMGQLWNVPGDNHCFYHELACGMLDRQAQSEMRHSWMGECTGDYSLMAELLNIVVKVFHPPGCQLDGSPLPSASRDKEPSMQGDVLGAEVSLDNDDVISADGRSDGSVLFIAGARCDAVLRGDPSRYSGIVAPRHLVEGLHVRNTCVPIRCVVQALQAADHQAIDKQMRYARVLHNSRILAKQNECAVFGVVHDGEKHFTYPHIYYHLLTDYKGDSLRAFAVA